VELAADGHRGLHFEAGQFARLRPAHRPYGLDDHPFTLSSSAGRPDRPAFTIKALGDFSSSMADLEVGTVVLVDGPHGEAIADAHARRGRLLLAAGIGITPAMSVIRTASERGDRRPLVLLYGSRRWADVTFPRRARGAGAAPFEPACRARAVTPGALVARRARADRRVPAAPLRAG
jgi:predicted ferric reductase